MTALYEDFADANGLWAPYDTYDANQRTALRTQRHVDLRRFEQGTVESPYTMFDLDLLTSGEIDTLTQQELEARQALQIGEDWVDGSGMTLAGSIGPQSDRNYFNGLSLSCASGLTEATSITAPINIAGFAPTDHLSLSLPAFPAGSLTLSSCFIDISSDAAFASAKTDSLAFTGIASGNVEASFAMSLLTKADLSNIVAVRFRIQATAACTFRCLAIRCLASSWQYAPIDQDTLYGRLGATVPPTGDTAQPYTFPAAGGPVTPSDWPILFFNDGAEGPQVVDADLGFIIDTGANSANSHVSIYLREAPLVALTTTTLDGQPMSQLDAIGNQPDYTAGTFDEFSTALYQTVTIQWGTAGQVTVSSDAATTQYNLPLSLAPNTSYYARILLADTDLSVQIHPFDPVTGLDLDDVTFDSGLIRSIARRRRGRLGWYAQLGEGNTYVRRFRPRRLVFGEYRSAPLASVTPVIGARLYAGASPALELLPFSTNVTQLAFDSLISLNTTKSTSGRCLQVRCSGTAPLQGLRTAELRFTDMAETEISFAVNAPASAAITALLRSREANAGEGALEALALPPLRANRWTNVTIPLSTTSLLPGRYELLIVQGNVASTVWYLDNLSIAQRTVAWEGRGQAADPWGIEDPPWVPFTDQLNAPYRAALLGRGRALQVRGQVVDETGSIQQVQILPQYRTLGRFVWPEDAPTYTAPPVASFVYSLISAQENTLSVDASSSTASGGILAYRWQFGDGSGAFGVTATHTFPDSGSYVVTLTVVDMLGQATSTTHDLVLLDPDPAILIFSATAPS